MLTSEATASGNSARTLARAWRQHRAAPPSKKPDLTVGVAASFTVAPLIPLIGGGLLKQAAEQPVLLNANYNQLSRVCLDPRVEFEGTLPDVIVFLLRLEDLTNAGDATSIEGAFSNFFGQLEQLRSTFGGTIVVALPPRPRPVDAVVEFSKPDDVQAVWYGSLVTLSKFARANLDTYTIDIERGIGSIGEGQALDSRFDYMYRQPYSDLLYLELAEQIVRICEARKSHSKKCVIVDCDNTLWGGIIGEDGIGGVVLSDDYPGRAFGDFQRQLKRLSKSGIFVALATKNNPSDVENMFRQHSAMVLSWDDVSVSKINWRPKSENIREIASELNIGLDSIVFIDDSPFEIAEVRSQLPEVLCIQVPEEITELPGRFMQASKNFDRLVLSKEDAQRIMMMRSEVERNELHQKLTEAEFLSTLELNVQLGSVASADLARVTQLINKTNQFNLTTRRYSLEEIANMAHDPSVLVYSASVTDRFGDYGLVGVGIVRFMADRAVFDTILMSCRVLGRGVESALLSYGVGEAKNRGYATIEGHYIPTRKNAMVGDLFPRHGFVRRMGTTGEAEIYDRSTQPLDVPDYLFVEIVDEGLERAGA